MSQSHSPQPKASRRRSSAGQVRRIVNVRLLLGTLIAIVVIAPVAHFWQQWQVQNNARAFERQARIFQEEENWREAADFLQRYLRLHPEDADATIELARVFGQIARSPREKARAVELYFRALGFAPSDVELRRKLAQLLLELGEVGDAEGQGNRLLEVNPHDPVGLRVRAIAHVSKSQPGGSLSLETALESLKLAVDYNPQDATLATMLAELYRERLKQPSAEERAALADAVLDTLVEEYPDQVEARLARFRYRSRYGVDGAEDDLERSLELAPDNLEVLLSAGDYFRMQRDDHERAIGYYERAIALDPQDGGGYLGLGAVYTRLEKYDEAMTALRGGIAVDRPRSLDLYLQLGHTQVSAGEFEAAAETINTLLEQLGSFNASMPREERVRRRGVLSQLQARWFMSQHRYAEALPYLRRVAVAQRAISETGVADDQFVEALIGVAACHAQMRQWDLAARDYSAAASLRPGNARYRSTAAEAWERAGRVELAIQQFEESLRIPHAPADIWLRLARARFQQQRQLLATNRDWTQFERALQQAQDLLPEDPDVELLVAQYEITRDQVPEAIARLEAASAAHPESEALLQSLVLVLDDAGRRADAQARLAEHEAQHGTSLNTLLMRAALLARRQQYAAAEELLTASLDELEPHQRSLVKYQVAQLRLTSGALHEAWKSLVDLSSAEPWNLTVLETLASIAADVGDWTNAKACDELLQKLEGSGGPLWRYYRARRLLAEASSLTDPRLAAAADLQQELQSLRPSWPQTHTLKGSLRLRFDQVDEAIEAFRTAIDFGDRSVRTVEQLVSLLYQRNRVAEAQQYLARLADPFSASGTLSALAISLSAEQGEIDKALQLAEEGVRRRPGDAASHVNLGHALMLAERSSDAEASFKQAIELAPDSFQPWLELVTYYVRTEDPAAARETLERLNQAADLGGSHRAALLAQGHELIGDKQEATRYYLEAVRLAPDNSGLEQRAATFLLTLDRDAAEKGLREMIELSPSSRTAQRSLAQVLAARGNPDDIREARELVASEVEGQPRRLADLVTSALLKLRSGEIEQERQAMRDLERYVRDAPDADPKYRLLLAQLYELNQDPRRAREELLALVSVEEPQPAYLAEYVLFLVRNDLGGEAGPWLEQLLALEPDSLRTATCRARWLAQQGRSAEIEPLLEGFLLKRLESIEAADVRARMMLETAALYASVGLDGPAERWYQKGLETGPQGHAGYASFLLSEGRVAEAVDLCLAAVEHDQTARAATVLCTILADIRVPAEERERAAEVLAAVAERQQSDVEFVFSLAVLRWMEDRREAAAEHFRRVLELDPQHVNSMNNLAMLLSETPDEQAEAGEFIQRALRLAGTSRELADTHGMVLLRQGRVDEALAVLEPMASGNLPQPVHQFHLALAYERAGKTEQAQAALKKAIELNLAAQTLTPAERAELAALEQVLGL